MNRYRLLCLALAFAAAGSVVRYAATSPVSSRGPVYECAGQVDFGPREEGDIAMAEVVIRNPGDEPLVISEVRSDCSCSGLERRSEGQLVRFAEVTVEPGGEVTLVSRLMVRGTPGLPEQHTVWFRTNDPACPEAAIRMRVSLVTGVGVSPASVQFGDVLVGEEVTREVEVLHSGVAEMMLTRVTTSHPDVVVADLTGPGARGAAATFRVSARPQEPGPVTATADVEYLRAGKRFAAAVPVRLTGVLAVTAYPGRLTLPLRSSAGPVYETTVMCRSHAGVPVTIEPDRLPPGVRVEVGGDADSTDPSVRLVTIRVDPAAWNALPADGPRVIRLAATRAGTRVPVEVVVRLAP